VPTNASPITSATIADGITVNSASTKNSRKISSTPKNTPVTGALNVAARGEPSQLTRSETESLVRGPVSHPSRPAADPTLE